MVSNLDTLVVHVVLVVGFANVQDAGAKTLAIRREMENKNGSRNYA